MHVLKWESKNLIALSTQIREWLTSKVAANVMQEGQMLAVLSTLLAAKTLPEPFATASELIDSAWTTAVDRSYKTGKLLAELFLKGLQGNRPVTLVGFSLGARVIFKCLQCLAEAKGDNAGLVERVVLLGAPVSIKDEKWEDARKMVARRFINIYNSSDWTFGIIFRARQVVGGHNLAFTSMSKCGPHLTIVCVLSTGLAGIQPIELPGIENVDATEFMEGHCSYIWKTKQIFRQLDVDNYNPVCKTKPYQPSFRLSIGNSTNQIGLNLLEPMDGGMISATVKASSFHLLSAFRPIFSFVSLPLCPFILGVYKQNGSCRGTQSSKLSGEEGRKVKQINDEINDGFDANLRESELRKSSTCHRESVSTDVLPIDPLVSLANRLLSSPLFFQPSFPFQQVLDSVEMSFFFKDQSINGLYLYTLTFIGTHALVELLSQSEFNTKDSTLSPTEALRSDFNNPC
ncbi:cytokinin dehydrogenase 5-like [Hibiscus syriacus]|uniref:Cytokinin dehydrogenase 5-like n=1 Tax=Hibiscus syriacus TaxID=106335 RepID=A0A6A2XKD8_HIBSY|nr:cytokinin dehydrogenase 5-like [Hibiscus syriacus]